MENFLFYDCNPEGRQLNFGESGFLAASEVVRTICDADFRKIGLNTYDSGTNALFEHKYVKEPENGMFLMEVVNRKSNINLLVFIDTRTKPNFVWIQPAGGDDESEASIQVKRMVENWLTQEAYRFGWKVKIKRSCFTKLVYEKQFRLAMRYVRQYVEQIPEFASCVTYEERTDEIIKMLHVKIDRKMSAVSIMKVVRAAIDTGLIAKPCYDSFIIEFGKEEYLSPQSLKMYTNKKKNLFADDPVYLGYVEKFLDLKDKWNDEVEGY